MSFFGKKKETPKASNASYPIQPPPAPAQFNMNVPINYYPNNIYTPGASLENAFDDLDAALTDSFDSNRRFYNKRRDPTVPPPPGTVQFAYSSSMNPPMMGQSPTPPAPPQVRPGELPPSYEESVGQKPKKQ